LHTIKQAFRYLNISPSPLLTHVLFSPSSLTSEGRGKESKKEISTFSMKTDFVILIRTVGLELFTALPKERLTTLL
jgi:hypothetical protein